MPAYHVPQIDHAAYPRRCRTMSDAELMFTIADAKSALAAMPDSDKASYYADEICYAADELARRARGGKRRLPTTNEIAAAAAAAAWSLCEGLDD
jgi:hypothetical protein